MNWQPRNYRQFYGVLCGYIAVCVGIWWVTDWVYDWMQSLIPIYIVGGLEG